MDCCSLPGSSVHGILQARILEWVAISFSRGSPQPRDRTLVSCTDRQILYRWATREALCFLLFMHKMCQGLSRTKVSIHVCVFVGERQRKTVAKTPSYWGARWCQDHWRADWRKGHLQTPGWAGATSKCGCPGSLGSAVWPSSQADASWSCCFSQKTTNPEYGHQGKHYIYF